MDMDYFADTFEAFKTQRHRWAYGAIQILKNIGMNSNLHQIFNS